MNTQELAQVQVHVIEPHGLYSVEQARKLLGLRVNSLRREIREGRLTASRRCKQTYLLGRHLLDWIAGGEVVVAKKTEQDDSN